ncbi:hypothetical protein D9619_003820 [Psilocybe cf. subviscida]|uniref:BTB domain-containing protein n=1 Tax=Psilocybe cf. subviscida TaxID=2480587 RepID=A0A8H5AWI0_9AGAR|nr:hypothetical protein D9619_003820 [Psilocybe cf. subviscida]
MSKSPASILLPERALSVGQALSASAGLQKINNIWFDDGNLVVIAGRKVFRLYQGLLARRSPVLRDMLSIPQPEASTAIDDADRTVIQALNLDVKDCAVVRFTDKPQEVEWFLSGFLGDSLITQYSANIPALTGILRLATKYEVNFLRKWAVVRLEQLMSITSDPDPDELIQLMRREEKDKKWMNGLFPLIDVAITVGVPWVLPGVFWRLQAASLVNILYHPEWKEFPEGRKSQFLLCREYAQADAFSEFGLVLQLHCQGSKHTTPNGRDRCTQNVKDALYMTFSSWGTDGGGSHPIWRKFVDEFGCDRCKKRYETQRRQLVTDAFLALQKHSGLPEHAKMMEKREKYFKEVSVDE